MEENLIESTNSPIFSYADGITTDDMKTAWKVKKENFCCKKPLVELYIPNKSRKRYFLGFWEIKPCMPIFVSLLIIYTTLSYFIIILPKSYFIAQILFPIPIVVFLVLFVWSYFASLCMDPGYLPYDWINTKKSFYSWQEQLSGLAVTKEQFAFALIKSNRPPHCAFSHTAGRYVIRGDHICGWVSNWIGKRNFKQFLLMTLYGGFFTLTLFCTVFAIKGGYFYIESKYMFATLPALTFEVGFTFFLFGMLASSLHDMSTYKHMNDERHSQNLKTICGNECNCFWFIPTPAFPQDLDFNTL